MIFDHLSLDQVGDEEILQLVSKHVSERTSLEFKLTINYSDDEEKLELLRDIVSLANCGGGYLIVGIRDDGRGRAQCFAKPNEMGDTRKIEQTVKGLSSQHIRERIEGLEIEARVIEGNPIVLVRVPDSDRRPHMVTYMERSDFWTRHQDGKRCMTVGEVREAFTKDHFGRRLDQLTMFVKAGQSDSKKDRAINDAISRYRSQSTPAFSDVEDPEALEQVLGSELQDTAGADSYHRLLAIPAELRPGFASKRFDELEAILKSPPMSRNDGWSMQPYGPSRRTAEGLISDLGADRELVLLGSGALVFTTPVNELFCHGQSDHEYQQGPRLYPYAVIEYAMSFLFAYRAILDELDLETSSRLVVEYVNIEGLRLPPFKPNSFGFMNASRWMRFSSKHYRKAYHLSSDFDPDTIARQLITDTYSSFGLEPSKIPAFSSSEHGIRWSAPDQDSA